MDEQLKRCAIQLRDACRMLAGVCNRARTKDGMGFNRWDADFGHYLASLDLENWRPQHIQAAYRMLGAYGKQLADMGIDALEKPPLDPEKAK